MTLNRSKMCPKKFNNKSCPQVHICKPRNTYPEIWALRQLNSALWSAYGPIIIYKSSKIRTGPLYYSIVGTVTNIGSYYYSFKYMLRSTLKIVIRFQLSSTHTNMVQYFMH